MVIPQIGSTANGGASVRAAAGAARAIRSGRALAAAHGDDLGEDRQCDLGRSARTDVDTGGNVDQREVRLGDTVGTQLIEHARTALLARDEADVRHSRVERAPQRVELIASVRSDDKCEVAGRRLGSPAFDRDELEPQLHTE